MYDSHVCGKEERVEAVAKADRQRESGIRRRARDSRRRMLSSLVEMWDCWRLAKWMRRTRTMPKRLARASPRKL